MNMQTPAGKPKYDTKFAKALYGLKGGESISIFARDTLKTDAVWHAGTLKCLQRTGAIHIDYDDGDESDYDQEKNSDRSIWQCVEYFKLAPGRRAPSVARRDASGLPPTLQDYASPSSASQEAGKSSGSATTAAPGMKKRLKAPAFGDSLESVNTSGSAAGVGLPSKPTGTSSPKSPPSPPSPASPPSPPSPASPPSPSSRKDHVCAMHQRRRSKRARRSRSLPRALLLCNSRRCRSSSCRSSRRSRS